jgi:hypothetical protein
MAELKVIPVEPVGWYSPFLVSDGTSTTKVQTVDIYTYVCTQCHATDCRHKRNGTPCGPCVAFGVCAHLSAGRLCQDCHATNCRHVQAVRSYIDAELKKHLAPYK